LAVEVETHIEPLQTRGLLGRDAAPERIAAVHGELTALAEKLGVVRDVHEVRVRETPDGEIVNFHAYVDPTLTVAEVHDRIDDLERALRGRFPTIKRIIGHAEPRRA
jgi:divalent metal cation (Fe/Co/Zn/Cd) transporter